MEKNTNLVSIIIACYNQAEYVSEAIECALNQTYKNVEVVVINDASTDNSSEVIKKYSEQYSNVIFLDEKVNKGVVASRNLAIKNSNGKYILPVDADDKIDTTYVEKAVNILDSDDEIRICYARSLFFGAINKEFKLADFNPNRIIFNNCIPNTAMYRREDFDKVCGYQDYMKKGWEDWNMWLSILEVAPNREKCAYRINELLYFYRQLHTATRSAFNNEVKSRLFVNMVANHQDLYSTTNFYGHIVKTLPSKILKRNKIIKILSIFLIIQLIIILVLLFI